uniref:Uncharacterized protein n=1 Tax=Octopus bimaculoides TaxID=37653 RepID=A0A0L8FJL0_OCTBM
MANERLPKTIFYTELATRHLQHGGPQLEFRDVLKWKLTFCGTESTGFETVAEDKDRDQRENHCRPGLRII